MTRLPALLDDEKAMIAAVHKGVVAVREKMAAGASREWLETTLRQFLHQGLIERLKVIEAADAGDEIADAASTVWAAIAPSAPGLFSTTKGCPNDFDSACPTIRAAWSAGPPAANGMIKALRQVFAEMLDTGIEPPATLKAYGIKAALRGPIKRGRGRSAFDNWKRDIGIAVMVFLTAKQFGLSPTRNREQRRRRQPSACSVVAAGLGQSRINVDEKTVEGIHHDLAGQVTDFAKRHFPHIF